MSADGTGFKDNLKAPVMYGTEELVFSQVAIGNEHMAAITEDGRLFTMGTTGHGKLGHEIKVQSAEEIAAEALRYKKAGYKPGSMDRIKPASGLVADAVFKGKKIISVACGDKHTVCVTEDGNVYSWGYGKMGALGHNDNETKV